MRRIAQDASGGGESTRTLAQVIHAKPQWGWVYVSPRGGQIVTPPSREVKGAVINVRALPHVGEQTETGMSSIMHWSPGKIASATDVRVGS